MSPMGHPGRAGRGTQRATPQRGPAQQHPRDISGAPCWAAPPPPRAQGLVAVRGPGDRTVPSPPSSAPWGGGRAPSPPPRLCQHCLISKQECANEKGEGGPQGQHRAELVPPPNPSQTREGGARVAAIPIGSGMPPLTPRPPAPHNGWGQARRTPQPPPSPHHSTRRGGSENHI